MFALPIVRKAVDTALEGRGLSRLTADRQSMVIRLMALDAIHTYTGLSYTRIAQEIGLNRGHAQRVSKQLPKFWSSETVRADWLSRVRLQIDTNLEYGL